MVLFIKVFQQCRKSTYCFTNTDYRFFTFVSTKPFNCCFGNSIEMLQMQVTAYIMRRKAMHIDETGPLKFLCKTRKENEVILREKSESLNCVVGTFSRSKDEE